MPNNPLKLAKDALDSAITQKKLNEQFVKNLGPAIVDALKPTLDNIAANARLPKQDVVDAISKIKIPPITIPPINVPAPNVIVKSPDIQLPEINVPEANVNVTVPDITIPDIVMPKELDVSGWVGLSGFNRSFVDNPLPVQLRDSDGKPVNLLENLTTLVSGGGGSSGKSDFFTIKGFGQSSFAEIMNADGRLKVSVETGGSGLTDAELRASHLDVLQLSGSIDSVYVRSNFGTTFTTNDMVNGDNRLRVAVDTGSSGLTDAELRASHLDVLQLSGSIDSVYVTNTVTVDTELAAAGALADNMANPTTPLVGACQMVWDGANWDRLGGSGATGIHVDITGNTIGLATSAKQLADDHNVTVSNASIPVTGTFYQGTQPISGTVTVSGITATTAVNLIDSSGVAYSGSNPVPVDTDVSSLATSAKQLADGHNVTIDNGAAGSAVNIQDGGNTITVDGTVTATPSGTQDVDVTANTIGLATSAKQLADGHNVTVDNASIRTIQVRGSLKTAYATVSTGTETSLLAATVGSFHDLVYVMGANSSDAAMTVDIRDRTAGSVIMSLEIPANSTAGVAPALPIPQSNVGNAWTVDMGDVSGTNIYITGLFSKET